MDSDGKIMLSGSPAYVVEFDFDEDPPGTLVDKFVQTEDADVHKKRRKVAGNPKTKSLKAIDDDILKPTEIKFDKSLFDWVVTGHQVQCDLCSKWRYLEKCTDPLELPELWFCSHGEYMCGDPEVPQEIEENNSNFVCTIENKYSYGSIVWAKAYEGDWWWPALVDHNNELGSYFQIDDPKSYIPTAYNVTFFSDIPTTALLPPDQLAPFKYNLNNSDYNQFTGDNENEFHEAVKTATDALEMTPKERLLVFSYLVRMTEKHCT